MTLLFKAKTDEGYTMKVLSELLYNNVRIACIKITHQNIMMRMMDSKRCVLIDIILDSDHFNVYQLNSSTEELYLGINMNHLYQMLKSIKKKDAIMLSIDGTHPDDLIITVFPKENNQIISSYVRIQSTQHISIPLPSGYSSPIIVPAGEYQRALKDMRNIGDDITISMKNHSLNIICNPEMLHGIFSRNVMFGELNDTSIEVYREVFNIEQFIRTIKVSGLSNNLQMFAGTDDSPLMISSRVGSLGTINIFIKSKSQIEEYDNN